MVFGSYVGVGVSATREGLAGHLDQAVPDVEELARLLGEAFTSKVLTDPAEEDVRRLLRSLPDSSPGVPLVVAWSGHAVGLPAGLRLLACDSPARAAAGVGVADLMASCAESGASQLLFVIDTCFAGQASDAMTVAAAIMLAAPPAADRVWVGVLASSLAVETARDGVFGERFRAVLAGGPRLPELQVRWSPQSRWVRGDDVCDAVLKDWDSAAQTPE
jgi:hypothetical protein